MAPPARKQALVATAFGGLSHRVLSGSYPRIAVSERQALERVLPPADKVPSVQHSAFRVDGNCPQPELITDAEDLFDLRRILEEGAIRELAEHATQSTLQELDRLKEEGNAGDLAFRQSDARFHLNIAELSGNRRLAEETARLIDLCDRLSVSGCSITPRAVFAGILEADHCAIIDAIIVRDAAKAVRLSATHLARTRTFLVSGSDRSADEPLPTGI